MKPQIEDQRRVVIRLLLSTLSLLAVVALVGCGGESDAGTGEQQTPAPPSTWEQQTPLLPGTSTTSRVFTATPHGGLPYKPTRIADEAGTSSIRGIRWRTWGGRTAVGVGVSSNGYRVTIRLRGVEVCNGKPTYLEWSIEREGGGKETAFSPIMSAHVSVNACDPEPDY